MIITVCDGLHLNWVHIVHNKVPCFDAGVLPVHKQPEDIFPFKPSKNRRKKIYFMFRIRAERAPANERSHPDHLL